MSKIDDLQHKNSEEVKDILERMPSHFGKIITFILVFISFLIFLFGSIIKYPDVVSGPITLVPTNTPVKLISKMYGALEFYDYERNNYAEGEYIAWIRNAAKVEDVKKIEKLLSEYAPDMLLKMPGLIVQYPNDVSLGEINQSYHAFLKSLTQHIVLVQREIFNDEVGNLTHQITDMKEQLQNAHTSKELKYKMVEAQRKNFHKDSLLFSTYANMAIPEMDFEKSRITYLNMCESYQNNLNEISNLKIQIATVQSRLNQLKQTQIDKEQDSYIDLYSAYNNLLDQIKAWEEKYVFKAPFNGNVEYLKFWTNGQFISNNEEFCTMIPTGSDMIGQMYLPSHGSGKVEKDQKVIIKLDNYPYLEYGALKGRVKNISQLTNTITVSNSGDVDTYRVEVILEEEGKTNYGSVLNLAVEAKGTAEIITKQRVLIERLFDNLKYVMK
ncbi:MAG: HlyD family secretion protein [Tannerella sp.]|nr:HlyD family secretion protein [Tannerella sp.]